MRRNATPPARHPEHDVDRTPLLALAADFTRWARRDLWTKSEAVCLLLEIEPIDEPDIASEALRVRYVGIKMLLEKNLDQTLMSYRTDPVHGPLFLPWAIIQWAESIPVPVSMELKSALMDARPSNFRTGVLLDHIRDLTYELRRLNAASALPYLRPDHLHFAPELAAAVAAWLALYQQRQYPTARRHEKQVRAWLHARYAQAYDERFHFSDDAIDRIAAVSTPSASRAAEDD